MNKVTTILTGLAIVATASIAPAFAQGNFSTNSPFVFSFSPANSFTATDQPVLYNALGTTGFSNGFLTLTGGTEIGTSVVYSNVSLSFSPTLGGMPTVTDVVPMSTVVALDGTGLYSLASVGVTAKGDNFNVVGAPVPEASTVISFGALLALGGLAVLRRKSIVKNAA